MNEKEMTVSEGYILTNQALLFTAMATLVDSTLAKHLMIKAEEIIKIVELETKNHADTSGEAKSIS